MHTNCKAFATATLFAALALVLRLPTDVAAAAQPVPRVRAVVVVFDGLRPDYVTATRMPNLHAFGASGVVSTAHHSLFPTVTRVNASALITGANPGAHGVLDNVIYLPTVDSTHTLNTGDAGDMMRADRALRALRGQLLMVPTLPDLLGAQGKRVVVASAGSSGSAYLLGGAGRAIILQNELVLPQQYESMMRAMLGPPPVDASPNLAANARAVDALLRIGIDSIDTDIGFLWLSDPDHTAHSAGVGSVMADSSIRAADREFGRLLQGLHDRGLDGQVDLFVVSDHGFSTHAGRDAPISAVLAPFKDRIVVAGGAVYVRRGGDTARGAVVRALQAAAPIGAIFTRARRDGMAAEPGTLPYDSIGWSNARSADVLFSADWSHAVNAASMAGRTEQAGTAGHGTTSPYDILATLIARGPHLRAAVRTNVASSNADIAPTLLHLLGMSSAPSMTGRALTELLRDGPAIASVHITRDSLVAVTTLPAPSLLRYRVTAYRTHVGRTTYFDSTKTQRTPD